MDLVGGRNLLPGQGIKVNIKEWKWLTFAGYLLLTTLGQFHTSPTSVPVTGMNITIFLPFCFLFVWIRVGGHQHEFWERTTNLGKLFSWFPVGLLGTDHFHKLQASVRWPFPHHSLPPRSLLEPAGPGGDDTHPLLALEYHILPYIF